MYRALLATGKDVPQVVAVKTLKGIITIVESEKINCVLTLRIVLEK